MATKNRNPKTFFVKTYGCQMNELDSEVISGELLRRGLTYVDNEHDADVLVFNTCSIRDLAERKVLGKLGQIGRTKKKEAIIGVTGCMANSKKASLFRKIPHIDFVIGTNNLHQVNDILDEVIAQGAQPTFTDKTFHTELNYIGAMRKDNVKAYVSIIRGCNKYCTYCIVPYTRGPEVSRDAASIVEECKALADQGIKEVMLLGQNVNSYGNDKPDWQLNFADLLAKVDDINGIERVRFMTSHPYDITESLMKAIRDLNTICEFVHFPIQHGSDRILRKMHRLYSVQEYLEKVAMLREYVPNVALGTDIIVGFPTETDEEFQQTYDIIKKIRYDVSFIFAYSPRKGTPSTRWKDDIPEDVKNQRVQALLALQNEICTEHRQALVGETVEVLVERKTKRDGSILKGRARDWKKVLFEGSEDLVGTLQNVKIHSYSHQTLLGDLI